MEGQWDQWNYYLYILFDMNTRIATEYAKYENSVQPHPLLVSVAKLSLKSRS